jgi:thiamine biosynthesis lipoprotein
VNPPEFGVEFEAMGTACRVRLAGGDTVQSREAANAAIAEVCRIETKYSRYRQDSVVSRINALAGSHRPVEADDETADLRDFAGSLRAARNTRPIVPAPSLRSGAWPAGWPTWAETSA